MCRNVVERTCGQGIPCWLQTMAGYIINIYWHSEAYKTNATLYLASHISFQWSFNNSIIPQRHTGLQSALLYWPFVTHKTTELETRIVQFYNWWNIFGQTTGKALRLALPGRPINLVNEVGTLENLLKYSHKVKSCAGSHL